MPLSKIVAKSITDNTITTDQIADTSVHGRRNLIINGAMQVAQRGTTFTTPANGTDILDRFSTLATANAASKVTFSQSTETPPGFRNSLKLDVVTALSSPAAGDYNILKYNGFEQQDIDHLAFGSSSAKQITMSFWVKSNKTGTLAVEFQYNSVEASNASVELAKLYTINAANTWEHKTLTWPAPTGHTSNQSAANGVGLKIYIWIAAGSSYASGNLPTDWGVNSDRVAGLDNYLDSTSNEIYFTGFQLEAGDKATPFEHRSFGEELTLCQRYFQQYKSAMGGTGDGTSVLPVSFTGLVPMRAAATISSTGALQVTSYAIHSLTQSSASVTFADSARDPLNASAYIYLNNFSGLQTRTPYHLYATTNYVTFDAEL